MSVYIPPGRWRSFFSCKSGTSYIVYYASACCHKCTLHNTHHLSHHPACPSQELQACAGMHKSFFSPYTGLTSLCVYQVCVVTTTTTKVGRRCANTVRTPCPSVRAKSPKHGAFGLTANPAELCTLELSSNHHYRSSRAIGSAGRPVPFGHRVVGDHQG